MFPEFMFLMLELPPPELELPIFPIFPLVLVFTVGAGTGVDIVDELFIIMFEFAFLAFELRFVLPSAPHPSITAETVKHRPVASSFLIFILSSQLLFLTNRRVA